jgi:hypothetical protein
MLEIVGKQFAESTIQGSAAVTERRCCPSIYGIAEKITTKKTLYTYRKPCKSEFTFYHFTFQNPGFTNLRKYHGSL